MNTPFEGCSLLDKLLSERGIALSSSMSSIPSLRGAAESLRKRGIPARLARVGVKQWPNLSLPTLVELPAGELALLRRVDRDIATIERANERISHCPVASLSDLSSQALELDAPVPSSRTLLRLLRLAFQERKTWLHVGVWSTCLALSGLALPVAAGRVLDHALPQGAANTLTAIAVAVALVGFARSWFGLLHDAGLRTLLGRVQSRMLRQVFDHALYRSYADVRKDDVGVTTQLMASSVELTELLCGQGLTLLVDGGMLVVYVAALSWHMPALVPYLFAVIVLSLSAVIGIAYVRMQVAKRVLTTSEQQQDGLFDLLSGAETLRAAGASRHAVSRWLGWLLDEQGATLARDRLTLLAEMILEGTRQIVTLSVFVWGGKAYLDGKVTLGVFVAAAMLAQQMGTLLSELGRSLLPLASARVSLSQLDRVMSQPSTLARPTVDITFSPQAPGIELTDVWFRYGPELPWVLSGENLKVEPGQHLILRSHSGSGKSTLLRLVAGLLTPERGAVRIGQRRPEHAQGWVAYLPQDTHLFEGSILDNLILFSGASPEALMQVAQSTGLHDWIQTLPMGYETILAPLGLTLSGGQRQWIRITAELASACPVLLLDEALSQLDSVKRLQVQKSPHFAHKTIVSVSHE